MQNSARVTPGTRPPVYNSGKLRNYVRTNYLLSFILTGLFAICSCSSSRNNIYFQSLQKDTTLSNLVSRDFDSKIQKNDLLTISVASLSPDNILYNAPQDAVGTIAGYSVDQQGDIQFIKLGKLHVEGLTKKDLKALLEKQLIPYLKDAVVSIGFLNRHVTLLGGIGAQVIPMPAESMTIFDALAVGGDIGERGRSDNVLVIREKDNIKEFKRLNLTGSTVFYSPYFYLQPNDIVYVEPVKPKTKLTTPQLISYITSGISLIILIVTQLTK